MCSGVTLITKVGQQTVLAKWGLPHCDQRSLPTVHSCTRLDDSSYIDGMLGMEPRIKLVCRFRCSYSKVLFWTTEIKTYGSNLLPHSNKLKHLRLKGQGDLVALPSIPLTGLFLESCEVK